MSKANGTIEKKENYLRHVSLKNYKSIKDAEIDFKAGLNVIIGKNASGKTNFINGLDGILNLNYEVLLGSSSSIQVQLKNGEIRDRSLSKNLIDEQYSKSLFINQEQLLKIVDEQMEFDNIDKLKSELSKDSIFFRELLIKYGIHYRDNAKFINDRFFFILVNNGVASREWMTVTKDNNRTQFIITFFNELYKFVLKLYSTYDKAHCLDLKNKIISFSEDHFKYINDLIYAYSPILSIRLNPNFDIILDEENQRQTINNFYLEFKIDQNWLPFNLLSDGSKRLFFMISEILAFDQNAVLTNRSDLNMVLFEEPELGIHPHQLHLLMQFIKEQSRYKQIILTTHSPQVLDIIGADELDRIIICEYDGKNGTQLRHLSEKEVNKARKYMLDEAFLSDYWRFSDLEPAS